MKLEVKAASKGHQEEGDTLIAKEAGEQPATREKGRRNPVAPPVEPVDLSIMARQEAPKAPPTALAAPPPPSKESVRERLAAALRGELKLPNVRKEEQAAPTPKPQISQSPSETVPVESETSEEMAVPKPAKPPKAKKAPKPAPAEAHEPVDQVAAAPPAVQATQTVQAPPPPAPPAPAKPKPAAVPKAEAPPAKGEGPKAEPKPDEAKPEAGGGGAPKAPPKRPMQARFTGMRPMHVVEAALFAAGKPVSVEEVAESTGLPPDTVRQAIKELQKDYEGRDTMLEVSKAGTKWGMQVKSQAAEPAAKFAPMEIAPKLLKTLALIAYHQPLKQSELVDMLGTKVYEHVPELVERGLVRAREEGVTKILTTTPAFPEYFGLDAAGPEEVRQVMGKLVGIDAPPKRKEPEPAADTAAAETQSETQPAEAPSGEPGPPTV